MAFSRKDLEAATSQAGQQAAPRPLTVVPDTPAGNAAARYAENIRATTPPSVEVTPALVSTGTTARPQRPSTKPTRQQPARRPSVKRMAIPVPPATRDAAEEVSKTARLHPEVDLHLRKFKRRYGLSLQSVVAYAAEIYVPLALEDPTQTAALQKEGRRRAAQIGEEPLVKIQVSMPRGLFDQIGEMCDVYRISETAFFRHAIDHLLANNTPEQVAGILHGRGLGLRRLGAADEQRASAEEEAVNGEQEASADG